MNEGAKARFKRGSYWARPTSGESLIPVTGLILGDTGLGVNREISSEKGYYRITHIPTSLAIGVPFNSQRRAKAFCWMLASLTNWHEITMENKLNQIPFFRDVACRRKIFDVYGENWRIEYMKRRLLGEL